MCACVFVCVSLAPLVEIVLVELVLVCVARSVIVACEYDMECASIAVSLVTESRRGGGVGDAG